MKSICGAMLAVCALAATQVESQRQMTSALKAMKQKKMQNLIQNAVRGNVGTKRPKALSWWWNNNNNDASLNDGEIPEGIVQGGDRRSKKVTMKKRDTQALVQVKTVDGISADEAWDNVYAC